MLLGNPQPGGMERAGVDTANTQPVQPLAQLSRGLARMGDGQRPSRVHFPRGNAVSEPVRHRAGLAGASPGDDANWAGKRSRSRSLLLVELVERRGHSAQCAASL